jgi:hypothetical protein
MEANVMRCKECKGEMSLRALDPLSGEEHGVSVKIERMPAMQCAQGHTRFVAPDFAVKMMNALLAGENLVELDPAKEKGLLRKRACCPQCGQELDAVGAGSVQARRQLELRGLDPFSVQVDLPKFRCQACSRECLPPEKAVVDGLMKAAANAFRSASISPI